MSSPISHNVGSQTPSETAMILYRLLEDARCQLYEYFMKGINDENESRVLCENVLALENAIDLIIPDSVVTPAGIIPLAFTTAPVDNGRLL